MPTDAPTAPPTAAPTAALARFAATAEVPPAVRLGTRRYLLDWLGSALAGGGLPAPGIVREVARELGGTPRATVLADGHRTSAPLAALANAAAAHVLEMDDLDRGSISHPGAPIVAAALAVAEQQGADGKQLLDAIAIGYEVSIRVGEALGTSHYEHWHTTGTAGTLGAAAAAARLWGLDEAATLRALGSAGTMAAGLWEFLADGAMSKQLHPGKAAHDGVLAAMLASRGFTAATRIVEGPKGLLAAMSQAPRPERLTEGLGKSIERWRIAGVSFKVHASCRHTHPAVDAVLALRRRIDLAPEQVDRVEVRMYSQGLALLDGMQPTTPYAAKFSLPFCVAAALVHGDLAPERFTEQSIAERRTLALAARVSYAADAGLDARYPAEWPSIVRVTTRSGGIFEQRVDHPAGDPELPLSDAELAEKFVTLTGGMLDGRAREVARLVLEAEPAPDATMLVRAAVGERDRALASVGESAS